MFRRANHVLAVSSHTGLVGGIGIGLPPVAHFGSDYLKDMVAGPVFRGEKRIALAVSEPSAGSDVASLSTTYSTPHTVASLPFFKMYTTHCSIAPLF